MRDNREMRNHLNHKKKAFDTVVHSKLLHKLDNIEIRGIALTLFKNYFWNRKQAFKVSNSKSLYETVISGIQQGTLPGPLMFIIYINDLSDTISQNFNIKLYADD